MTFEESMVRARAAHAVRKTVYQPGENYRAQRVCRCGAFLFVEDWNAHVLRAADQLRAESQEPCPMIQEALKR